MLSKFPVFKKLELEDKTEIQAITSQYQPYSDFNFVSMWSWDVKGEMRVSELHNSLVVKFTDYLTGQSFLSFLGGNDVNDTAASLLTLSHSLGYGEQLKLVPEVSVKNLDLSKYIIEEDRDHFDYIFNIKKISFYEGPEYSKHRKLVRRFEKNSFEIVNLDLTDKTNQKILLDLVEAWVYESRNKNEVEQYLDEAEIETELVAFKKLLSAPPELLGSLVCSALFVDGALAGFIINEKISRDYCIAHFGKANVKHQGIYHFLMQQNARVFLDLGINYLNHEQDLGLPNLRYSKSAYQPTHFLKKYSLARK